VVIFPVYIFFLQKGGWKEEEQRDLIGGKSGECVDQNYRLMTENKKESHLKGPEENEVQRRMFRETHEREREREREREMRERRGAGVVLFFRREE